MGLGAAAAQTSPMEDYIRSYGARLQSLLAGTPGYGGGGFGGLPVGRGGGPMAPAGAAEGGEQPDPQGESALADAGRTADLGPDTYRNTGLETLGGPQGQGGAAAPPPGAQGPQAAPQPGASPGAGQGGEQGQSFRDVWNSQDNDTRQQYLDKLQNHLKAAHQSIDSAYTTMMKQLGGRPDTELSKDEKGMLLMEFGMRMMEHSSGRAGYGRDTGAAAGAAGVETLGSMRGLKQQKLGRQEYYDKLQQQLTIARGKEHAQLAARSALEEGRDVRAFGAQDTALARTGMQQAGAGARTGARITAAADRTATTEAGKDRRSALARQDVVHSFVDNRGHEIGTRKSGETVDLGPAAAGSTGMRGGGGKGFAAESNYRMYMDTYGNDEQGQPLKGQDMAKVQRDALKFASNPKAFALTDADYRRMAEKSADNYIRANSLSWAGQSDEEIAGKHASFAEEAFQRMKRNGTAGPSAGANVPNQPKSALAGTGGATAQQYRDMRATPPGPPTGSLGPPPTQSPPGAQQPNPQHLAALKSDPAKIAPFFLRKFGYLPPEYQKYLNPTGIQSALH